jgi:hypothetical protein
VSLCPQSRRILALICACSIGLPEAGQLVANVSALYAPELTVGLSAVRFIHLPLFDR